MSNPTELPDVDAVAEAIFKVFKPSHMIDKDWNSGAILGFENGFRDQVIEAAKAAQFVLARRAQPEGEASQAEHSRFGSLEMQARILSNLVPATLSPLCGAQHAESGDPVGEFQAEARQAKLEEAVRGWSKNAESCKDGAAIAAFKTWHEEVGDQDCEYTWLQAWTAAQCSKPASAPGTPEAPQPPFPVSDEEMAALRRFWECASDGEGYDVEKAMMQRLAEMGLVQRKSGAYYMATDFGLYVLGEYTVERAAQLDGGQEGSGSNG